MRYPPDEWSILPEDRFATHVVDDAEQSLTADVLLQVSRNAKLEGCFKIQLGGSEILHADCPAKESDGLVKKKPCQCPVVLHRVAEPFSDRFRLQVISLSPAPALVF